MHRLARSLLLLSQIQVIAFQSLDGKQNHMLRALPLALVKRSAVIDLESSLSSSKNALTRSGSTKTESLEQDTGDSRATAGAFKSVMLLWSYFVVVFTDPGSVPPNWRPVVGGVC
ncbi:putative protein S-acyltransferase 14 [Camellia lanceoleosa]|uniref:Uncharacterized protein n=1 Tax=Camellia lanceoleosa TaxID=1840588 RepID=A0ACC0GKL0_9ERIC|nr:putative protein S-acyltransferase 14 [Camellia lanceoleosa]